jgi:hypothetical protein
MVVISLTDREQTLLSDSVLTMIENAGQAQRLVCDTESQKAIDIHIKELQALNRKLCTTGRNLNIHIAIIKSQRGVAM